MTDEDINTVKTLTGCDNTELVTLLLTEAKDRVLGLTGRTKLIPELYAVVRELAVCYYNRLGSEGMASRSDSEVGITSTFADVPETVQQQLQRYRLARVGGVYYEET